MRKFAAVGTSIRVSFPRVGFGRLHFCHLLVPNESHLLNVMQGPQVASPKKSKKNHSTLRNVKMKRTIRNGFQSWKVISSARNLEFEQKRCASSAEHSLFHISSAGTGPLLPIPAILNSAETAETRRLARGNNRLSKYLKKISKKPQRGTN